MEYPQRKLAFGIYPKCDLGSGPSGFFYFSFKRCPHVYDRSINHTEKWKGTSYRKGMCLFCIVKHRNVSEGPLSSGPHLFCETGQGTIFLANGDEFFHSLCHVAVFFSMKKYMSFRVGVVNLVKKELSLHGRGLLNQRIADKRAT